MSGSVQPELIDNPACTGYFRTDYHLYLIIDGNYYPCVNMIAMQVLSWMRCLISIYIFILSLINFYRCLIIKLDSLSQSESSLSLFTKLSKILSKPSNVFLPVVWLMTMLYGFSTFLYTFIRIVSYLAYNDNFGLDHPERGETAIAAARFVCWGLRCQTWWRIVGLGLIQISATTALSVFPIVVFKVNLASLLIIDHGWEKRMLKLHLITNTIIAIIVIILLSIGIYSSIETDTIFARFSAILFGLYTAVINAITVYSGLQLAKRLENG